MSTLLPPKRTRLPRVHDVETGGAEPRRGDEVDYLELCMRKYPQARHRAMLSIVPGLGQLRNGEVAKGALFLLCALASSGVMAALVLTKAPVAAQILYMLLVAAFVGYTMRDAYDRGVQIVRDKWQPKKYAFSLPEAASGSYLFHAALMIGCAIAVFFLIQPPPPSKQVTVIELTAPEKPKPPAAKHEPKRDTPKPKAIEPKPLEKPVVKPVEKPVVKPVVQKVVPQPVAVATPTNEPTPMTAAPIAAAPPAADPTPAAAPSGGGTTGGTGTGGGDGGGEVDMGPWMREMQRRIKKNWFPPKGSESVRIKVTFKVAKSGTVRKVKLLNSSGISMADDAAIQAIQDASPFSPLPDGVGDEVDINFTFDYNVFGGRH